MSIIRRKRKEESLIIFAILSYKYVTIRHAIERNHNLGQLSNVRVCSFMTRLTDTFIRDVAQPSTLLSSGSEGSYVVMGKYCTWAFNYGHTTMVAHRMEWRRRRCSR